jgi:hypothetical protein
VHGLGSFWLAGRQAQARQVKLAVLGVPELADVRHHDRGDRPQPRDKLSRFFQPAHMRVACGENAVRHREGWIFLDREAEFRHGLVKASADEVGEAHHGERRADAGARTEAQRGFAMLDRDVGLARLEPKDTTDMPAAQARG